MMIKTPIISLRVVSSVTYEPLTVEQATLGEQGINDLFSLFSEVMRIKI